MKKILVLSFLSIGLIFVNGCTTCGPFVTNISSDGKGNLLVEKANIELNTFTGDMKTIKTSTSVIKVGSEDKK